jgi:hypothetical protein
MFLKIPYDDPVITYLTLEDKIPTRDMLTEWSSKKYVDGFVENMKLSVVVKYEVSDKMFHLLTSGKVELGLPHTPVYRIIPPIRVDDMPGKTQYNFIVDLELINNQLEDKELDNQL